MIAAGVFYAFNRSAVGAPPSTAQIVRATVPQPTQPPRVTPVEEKHASTGQPARVETVRVARTVAHIAPRSAEPEVLVPLNQMAAVRRLVSAVNEGRIEVPAEPPQGPMAAPVQLSVAPVVVEPIPVSPMSAGGTQE